MYNFLIRVDSNGIIGTGHLMRCLAIAKELKKNCNVKFVFSDENSIDVVRREGFSYRCLDSEWNNLNDEISKLLRLIAEENAKAILVDSYQVTSEYLAALQKEIKVLYMDDLHEYVYPCDVLINYALFAHKFDYVNKYDGTNTKFLLGCSYIPLREEFYKIEKKEIVSDIKSILVLTGGTDSFHFALNFVKEIAIKAEWKHIEFHIICGKYNEDLKKLETIQLIYENINIYHNLVGLCDYMINADLAISAAGTTLYELSACGTPTIGYALADNQLENLQTFAQEGCIESVGDIRSFFPKEELIKKMEKLSNSKIRSAMSERMRRLVDGKGCARLAEEIVNLYGEKHA